MVKITIGDFNFTFANINIMHKSSNSLNINNKYENDEKFKDGDHFGNKL